MKLKEIEKLHQQLNENNIPHEYIKFFDGYQICYPNSKELSISVIECSFSYGNEKKPLEIFSYHLISGKPLSNKIKGYLTANEALYEIKRNQI